MSEQAFPPPNPTEIQYPTSGDFADALATSGLARGVLQGEPVVDRSIEGTFTERLETLLADIDTLPDTTNRLIQIDPENDPENPKRQVLLADLEKASKGWKLHLNFDPDKTEHLSELDIVLSRLKNDGAISSFKVGDGGGAAHDAPGNEATVYVGSRKKTELVAQFLEDELDGVLTAPEGDALKHDISFASKVMGRFEVDGYDPEFHQYGGAGIPYLKREHAELRFMPEEEQQGRLAELRVDSLRRLEVKYGDYFTG